MNLLAIDTSSEKATIALAANNEIHSEVQDVMRQHAQHILPIIQRLLAKNHVSIKELDGIVFGRGPGSFTGLRISSSVAKALAYAYDIPVFPVSTLAAIAYDAKQNLSSDAASFKTLAVMDARMNQLYWAWYEGDDYHQAVEKVTDADALQVAGDEPIVLAGIGYEGYIQMLPQALLARVREKMDIYPNAEAMINLVQSGHVQSVTADAALPVYVRNQVTHGGAGG